MKNKSLEAFYHELSSDAPTPGGGAVIAYVSSLALGLTSMSALISKKRKSFLAYDEHIQEEVNQACLNLSSLGTLLLNEIQKDIDGFNKFMDAFRMPKNNEDEASARELALKEASNNSIMLPYHVLDICLQAFKEYQVVFPIVVKSIISDLAIGIILLEACIESSIVNIKINLPYVNDENIIAKVDKMLKDAYHLINNDLKSLKYNVLTKLD